MAAMMEVFLRLHQLRDWRVVMAEDANGRRCECLLLPMLQNGIMKAFDSNMPYMRLLAPPTKQKNKDGFINILVPTIVTDVHDEMLRKGLIDPDAKHWSSPCGGIRFFGANKKG